ncbi:MAG: hypothetical protein AAB414_03305 [Patescibacteria group bacterium]
MATFKKLLFGPLFLLTFTFLIYQLKTNLGSYEVIFSFSAAILVRLLVLSGLVCLSSFLFVLFVSFSSDWKIVLPVAALASILPIIFMKDASGLILGIGLLLILLLTFLTLENTLKTYLNFEPASIFGPSIRHTTTLLLLVFSFTYFLSMNKIIQTQGFAIPDSLIDTALKFTPTQSGFTDTPQIGQEEQTQTTLPQISQEQIDLLKQNPDLLKQSCLDPAILDTLNKPTTKTNSQDLVKEAVKSQLQNFIKPYLGFIPAIMAILLFITLQSLTSFINLLIYPFLWIIFYILEKSKFVTFTTEMRPVKKMVI